MTAERAGAGGSTVPHRGRPIRPGPLAAPLADLLHALHVLRPCDEPSLAAILRILGHGLAGGATSFPSVPAPSRPVSASPRQVAPGNRRDELPAARVPLPSEIVVQSPAQGDVPGWMTDSALLPLSRDSKAVLRSEMPPLLAPRRQRALVAHVGSRLLPVGDLDLERVVQTVVESRPAMAVPRRLVAWLGTGVQLLCDVGVGMEPFALDVQALTRLVLSVVGRDRVRVEHFVGCPTRGLLRWDGAAGRYRFPPPGQPVLVVSDLGSIHAPGMVGRPDEWLAFVKALRRRGSDLAVLFPGTARSIPVLLRGRVRVLPLDRETGVRQAAARAS